MDSWVILFRGVGGETQLPVKQLRDTLIAEGFQSVATYINSGNAVLASPLPREEIVKRVCVACARDMGFTKAVYAMSRAEWSSIVENNPFPEAASAPTSLHAFVLAEQPNPERVAALDRLVNGRGGIRVIGKVAYLHTPDGFSNSKMAEKFDKGIGVANTGRNWNSVLRLRDMVDAAVGAAQTI